MRHELIQHIQDIQAQKKSGLLMAMTQVADLEGMSATPVNAHFSFFFKEGVLATVLCRGAQSRSAMSKIPSITGVTRVQFTVTSASTITVAKNQVDTAQLLEMLGAQAVSAADQASATREAQNRIDTGQELKARGQKVFGQIFGGAAKSLLDSIGTCHDPANDPAGFLEACIAELSPLVGQQSAKDMMNA